MEDIVERLRFAADDTDAVENASVAYLLEDAAAEIHRLRLTDEERAAVRTAAGCMGMWMLENGITEDESLRRSAATLRGLLDRLG